VPLLLNTFVVKKTKTGAGKRLFNKYTPNNNLVNDTPTFRKPNRIKANEQLEYVQQVLFNVFNYQATVCITPLIFNDLSNLDNNTSHKPGISWSNRQACLFRLKYKNSLD